MYYCSVSLSPSMEMELSQSQTQFQIQKPLPILLKRETTRTHKRSQTAPRPLAALKQDGFSRKQRRVVVQVEDEEEDVEGKITALQRVVPGGKGLGADELFEETAGYILALQSRVKALRALTSFFDGLHKEKMKLGG